MAETKSLQVTDDEILLLHWMAGYSARNLPPIFEESYHGFMKKLAEISLHRGG